MISRRRLFAISAGMVAAPALLTGRAGAQAAWPAKVVRLIVPYPPGGGADTIARLVGGKLSEYWGQQVVVESRAGAGGNIASEAAARSPADGYTLYMAGEFIATNPFIYSKLTFDAVKDLEPVSLVVQYPGVMVVPNTLPAKTLQEFIALARKDPGKYTFATPGTGTGPHLAGELFKRRAGIDITHVPYRGAAPAIQDVVPGRVDSFFNNIAPVMSLIKQNQVKALAVTTARRTPGAPDIPTMAEAGIEGFDVAGWYAFFFPAGTPAGIVGKVSDDTRRAVADPAVKARLEELGLFVMGSTADHLRGYLKSEMDLWGPIIKDANIRLGD